MIRKDNNYSNIENHVNTILKNDIYGKRKNIINICPYCKSEKYIKYGKFKGTQRFKCKKCGKTFSLVTGSIWSYSKKKANKWAEFVELILEKKVLRECADILDININTAFVWRHKVLKILNQLEDKVILEGVIHMTKISIKENFKGNKNIKTSERENVIVVSAKGDWDTIISMPLSKRLWNWNTFESRVYSRINKGSYIVPYADRYIFLAAKKYNNDINLEVLEDNKLIKNFKRITNGWFKRFKGVATKYLSEYFAWFILFYREKIFNDVDLLYELSKYSAI